MRVNQSESRAMPRTMQLQPDSCDAGHKPASRPHKSRFHPAALGLALMAVVTLAAGCGRPGDGGIAVAGTSTVVASTATTQVLSQTVPTTAPPPTQLTYVVQSGDSLSVIAERFSVSTKALAEFNAIADAHTIKVGQELNIPPTTVAPAPTTAPAATVATTAG